MPKASTTPAFRLTEPYAPQFRPNAEIPIGTILHLAANTEPGAVDLPRHRSVSMDPRGSFPTLQVPTELLEPIDLPSPDIKPAELDPAMRTHKDFALEHGANLVRGLNALFATIRKITHIKGVSAEEFSVDVRSLSSLKFAFEKRLNRAMAFGFGPELVPADQDDAEERCYLIKKGGYWYRENRFGYTAHKYDAGRFTKAEADAEVAVEPWHMLAIHENQVSDDSSPATMQELKQELAYLRGERQAMLDTDRWLGDIRTTHAREQGAQLAWQTLVAEFEALGNAFVPAGRRTEFREAVQRLGAFDTAHLEAVRDLTEEPAAS